MSFFGKHTRYCPNCGDKLYDEKIEMKHVMSMMCSNECRDEWQIKNTRMILGKSEDETVTK